MANTPNKNLDLPTYDSPNWDTPLNSNFSIIDAALSATANVVAIAPGGVLTTDQHQRAIIKFTGVLTANTTYRIPGNIGGIWVIHNATTTSGGNWAFTISGNPSGGASVEVPPGQIVTVYSDGASAPNIYGASVFGKDKQIIFNNLGTIAGNDKLTFDGTAFKTDQGLFKDGSAANPSIGSSQASASGSAGMFFSGADASKGLGFATADTLRFLINNVGALGIGASQNFGTAGQVMKSAGSGAPPVWANGGLTDHGNVTQSSGQTVSWTGLNLQAVKFLIVSVKQARHGASADRNLRVGAGGTDADAQISELSPNSGNLNGMAIIHVPTGAGFAVSGLPSNTRGYSNGFVSNIGPVTATVLLTWNSNAGFAGGTFNLSSIS